MPKPLERAGTPDQPDYAIQPFERGRQGKPYEKNIKDGETTLGTPNETNTDLNDAEVDERYQNRLDKYNYTNQHTQRGNQGGYDDRVADYNHQ
ncbi:unnamed protein product, partial [Symbiodinium necroappetens]